MQKSRLSLISKEKFSYFDFKIAFLRQELAKLNGGQEVEVPDVMELERLNGGGVVPIDSSNQLFPPINSSN
jgi:hypothetical protein